MPRLSEWRLYRRIKQLKREGKRIQRHLTHAKIFCYASWGCFLSFFASDARFELNQRADHHWIDLSHTCGYVKSALGFGETCPPASASIFAASHRARAMCAANAGIILIVQHVVRNVVPAHITPHHL